MRHAAPVLTDEALRQRLSDLARAAGLPVPPVEEDTKEGTLPRVRGRAGEERIVVPPELFEASTAEQTWHLAACLGWWFSPVPRRRRRQGLALMALTGVVYFGVGIPLVTDMVDLPRVLALAIVTVLHVVPPTVRAARDRREQRALDAAGHDVLRSAGHDPAAVARDVFGGQPDPPWFRQPFRSEPAPSERIAAAERWTPEPPRPRS
jgi:hypothetical protein